MSGDILFTSAKNYMKRDSSSGSGTMAAPNVVGTFYTTSDKVITHNLGYVPLFRAFYEPYRDGRILEALSDSQYYFADPINTAGGTPVAPTLLVQADSTTLKFTLGYQDATLAGTADYPIYWVIYRDYGLA